MLPMLLTMAVLQQKADTQLWYRQPAEVWTQALPVGNGRLGAMVFGRVPEERIQLNEETIWAGGPWPEHKDNMSPVFERARRLLFEGKVEEAQNLIGTDFMAEREGQRSYQTLGDLNILQQIQGLENPAPISITGWKRGPVSKTLDPASVTAT